MNRLDVSFLGRDARPIVVRTGREITHRATWGKLIFAGQVVIGVLMFLAFVLTWAVMVP